MRADKRKQLQQAGWQVGSAESFLELSGEGSAYIEMKLALSDALKSARTRRKLTQADLAKLIASSQSRVAKMEAGDPSVSIDLLVRSLLALGVPRKQVSKALAA